MAARYFVGGGTGNWNSTSNWSDTDGGASGFSVPTAVDDVFLTAASGSNTLTVNVTSVAKSLICNGFTGTLAGSSSLTISGNITFFAGMTLTYSGTLTINETATLTSGGKTLPGNLTTSTVANTTFTLADAWVVTGNFSFGNAANLHTFNGFTITIGGGLTITGNSSASGSDGTTEFIMNGTGTILHSGGTAVRSMRNPFIINTTGTITFDTNTVCFGGDFTYTAGTVTTTGSLVYFNNNSGTKTLVTNGITFNSVTFANVATTYTLSNIMVVDGALVFGTSNSNTYTINGSSISTRGNISVTISSGVITGTTVLNINGTGSQLWSHSVSTTRISLPLNINKSSGTLTLGANVVYSGNTIAYIAGIVDTTTNNSTLNVQSTTASLTTTFDTSGITWNNIAFSITTPTYTLTTDLNIGGTFIQSSGSNITFNGADVYCNGSVTVAASNAINITGTSNFFFIGTGTWSGAQAFNCNITITGTYTVSGTVGLTGDCAFTCTTGTLITIGSTFSIPISSSATISINTNQALNNLSSGTATITLLQDLTLTGTLSYLNDTAITLNGNTLYIGGSLTLLASTIAAGTTNLVMNGTGTWNLGTVRNNLTINTSGTITINGTVNYNTGILTYTSGTVISTGSTLNVNGTATLNTNTLVWNNVSTNVTATYTLLSDLKISGIWNCASGTVQTFTGAFNINCSGVWNCQGTSASATFTGGTTVTLSGTAWQGRAVTGPMALIGANITINTPNTFTITNQLRLGANCSITYVPNTGTIVPTGSTLFFAGTGITMNTSGMTWGTVAMGIAVPSTTLLSNLNCETFLVGIIGVVNGFTIRTNNLTISGNLSGTSNIEFVGTGTWSHTTTNVVVTNVTINTPGTLIISGSVYYSTGALTYVSGTVITTGSTLVIAGSSTLNTSVVNWNNISTSNSPTLTFTSTFNVLGNFTCGIGVTTLSGVGFFTGASGNLNFNNNNADTTLVLCNALTFGGSFIGTSGVSGIDAIINGFSVTFGGSLTQLGFGAVQGTTTIIMSGTGTIKCRGTITCNLDINTSGTYTFTLDGTYTYLVYSTNNFRVLSGTIVVQAPVTIGGATVTLNQLLTLPSLTLASSVSFTGSNGFTTTSFSSSTAGAIHTFKSGNTYTITSSMIILAATNASRITFNSSSPGVQAILTLNNSASQNLMYVNATDIDSSLGQTIYSFNGVLNNATNWDLLVPGLNNGGNFIFIN